MFILIIALLIVMLTSNYECLVSKPSDQMRQKLSMQIEQNKELFSNSSDFELARDKLYWLDAITYEDARKLHRNKSLSANNIMKYL